MTMYFFRPRSAYTAVEQDPRAVTRHRGTLRQFLKLHEHSARHEAKAGPLEGARRLAPHLFGLLSDERALKLAWDDLAATGGQAPGPDGLTYAELSGSAAWDLMRKIRDRIRAGEYRPGPEREVRLEKPGGGERVITLMGVADRVVQRAAARVLGPVLEPLFEPTSFGSRPHRGPPDALAWAEALSLSPRRDHWVAEDVRDAFGSVPVPRLLQVVAKVLPDDRLAAFLESVLAKPSGRGLRQGGSLSPLMANLYMHWHLDRPWRLAHPHAPLLRYVDDLLLLCRSGREAGDLHAELVGRARQAGLALRGPGEVSPARVDEAGVEWLGFAVRREGDELEPDLGPDAWDRLSEVLRDARGGELPTVRAWDAVRGWVDSHGPCFRPSSRLSMAKGVWKAARQMWFDELPGKVDLMGLARGAFLRWRKLRKRRMREAAAWAGRT